MSTDPKPRSLVPQLTITQDNSFFFEGCKAGKLLIQRCADCGTLRHPPGPACPSCRSFNWDTVESTRQGTLHSWTVVHHPKDPALTYPLMVGLIDLAEGTRFVADMEGIEEDELVIGMPLEVTFGEHPHGEILPRLRRPAGGEQ